MDAAIHRERDDVYMWSESDVYMYTSLYRDSDMQTGTNTHTKIHTDTAVGRVPQ